MNYRLITTVSALALTLAGCSSSMMMPNSESQSPTYVETRASDDKVVANGVHRTTVFVTDSPENQSEYRSSLAGPGLLAMVSSQLAQQKTRNPQVRAFADAEVAEQAGISRALKAMNTTIPLLNADQQDIMGKLTKAAPGREFDEAYMDAQLTNHKRVLMLTKNYLGNTSSFTRNPMERQTRDMAKMSLPVIKRHLDTAEHLEDMLD